MYEQLERIATHLAADRTLLAVVFQGDPQNGFAAGTDIGQFTKYTTGADGVAYERRVGAVLAAVDAIPALTVAVVERAAVGAGLAVAASCDLVIAERGARFGAPIARTLGNCLPIGVVHRLRSRLGAARTATMLLTAALVPAEDLVASGFVSALAEPGGLATEVDRFVERVATLAPLTVRSLKQIGRRLDATVPLPDDEDLLDRCYGSSDFREGVAAFLDKRKPEWTGT
jgi:enoyl-CoA hydratase